MVRSAFTEAHEAAALMSSGDAGVVDPRALFIADKTQTYDGQFSPEGSKHSSGQRSCSYFDVPPEGCSIDGA